MAWILNGIHSDCGLKLPNLVFGTSPQKRLKNFLIRGEGGDPSKLGTFPFDTLFLSVNRQKYN